MKTDELRYAWARDEWKRLDMAKPNWKTDDSFTIRFSNVLTHAALDEIYWRILEMARMERRIHDALARSALAESVVISIGPATLAIRLRCATATGNRSRRAGSSDPVATERPSGARFGFIARSLSRPSDRVILQSGSALQR
jgi:hypothetical protein